MSERFNVADIFGENVFNDTVITAPMVNARIESGTFQISPPHRHDLERIFEILQKEIETSRLEH